MPKFTLTMEVEPGELGEFESLKDAMANSEFLKSLCRKEVNRFEQYCNATDPNFRDGAGFVKIEALVLQGYLYQMVKGHIDAYHAGDLPALEGYDG